MTRTDPHRPSAIVPSDYEYVAPECLRIEGLGDALMLKAFREKIQEHMARTGGTYSRHEHGGNCMVCGNVQATYTILFYHRPTNTYVRMGQDCAEQVDSLAYDAEEVQRLRRFVTDARAHLAGKAKAQALLADAGLSRCWDLYTAPLPEQDQAEEYEERTVRDIVGRLVTYGDISDRQMAYLGTLLTKIDTRAERAAQREAEHEAAAPAPTGRVDVTGLVLSTKAMDGYVRGHCGPIKMLVQTDAGWKLWVTCPDALLGEKPLRGERVSLRVTVIPSKDDPKFAFGKRPMALSLKS
jgi:hypothetical protein